MALQTSIKIIFFNIIIFILHLIKCNEIIVWVDVTYLVGKFFQWLQTQLVNKLIKCDFESSTSSIPGETKQV